ncbi:hypothetical protein [Bradymonas sediminis]|uniref:Uncharacterized protein n=1 Tax=Bradymonas sediminis TaxID=1548548 RepID=A0A2Z4FGM1_9DELT|nr:hypothetical protein [Bradymonas sediminis]AWV88131.1 hypothetical protein DN745_01780 [Bradymonas sediminis]TDP77254.1 hypothetical protein DFR33_101154 [Bradymonas sediminis]
MSQSAPDILAREVPYLGQDISRAAIESMIVSERTRQRRDLAALEKLREHNAEIQQTLVGEVEKLRQISGQLSKERERGEFSRSLRNFLAKLPWVGGQVLTHRSIEEILREQYELSARRAKEAAEFVDRLEAAKVGLWDEIDRLNQKIVESAKNEELAVAHIRQLEALKSRLEVERAAVELSSADGRQAQALLDRTHRALSEHATKLKLYATAENRLAKLQENTRQLAETIGHLQSDIVVYVTAATEKLDLISGQIQAIGVAADASVVMFELQHSLKAMTESVNHATRFVSETQVYFRENVDAMLEEMELYDDETQQILAGNLALNEGYDQMDIAGAMSLALADKIEQAARQAGVGSNAGEVVLDFEGAEEAAAQQVSRVRSTKEQHR